jgi:tRNA pseudouridine38-40 synthase
MNIRIDIEYDGTQYCGWQKQGARPTIQGYVEDCLQRVVGDRVILYGAGRTDSGVHAKSQVANFYVTSKIAPEKWANVLNAMLPGDIRILRSREMPPEFHAQKKAIGKIYEYHILNRMHSSALDRRVYFCPFYIDWDKIKQVLPHFVGRKNFSAFQSKGTERKTTIRTIHSFELLENVSTDKKHVFVVHGSGFLKQMVRNMIGTLLEVGQGNRSVESIPSLFEGKTREFAGRAVPAVGLFLREVIYPKEFS